MKSDWTSPFCSKLFETWVAFLFRQCKVEVLFGLRHLLVNVIDYFQMKLHGIHEGSFRRREALFLVFWSLDCSWTVWSGCSSVERVQTFNPINMCRFRKHYFERQNHYAFAWPHCTITYASLFIICCNVPSPISKFCKRTEKKIKTQYVPEQVSQSCLKLLDLIISW